MSGSEILGEVVCGILDMVSDKNPRVTIIIILLLLAGIGIAIILL